MYPHEQHNRDEQDPLARHHGLDLWFYEKRGSRYYLRLTRLAVALILIPSVLTIVAIVAIFFYQVNRPMEEPNINISMQPGPAVSPQTLIKKPPPPPPLPPVRRSPNINASNQLVAPTPNRKVNER